MKSNFCEHNPGDLHQCEKKSGPFGNDLRSLESWYVLGVGKDERGRLQLRTVKMFGLSSFPRLVFPSSLSGTALKQQQSLSLATQKHPSPVRRFLNPIEAGSRACTETPWSERCPCLTSLSGEGVPDGSFESWPVCCFARKCRRRRCQTTAATPSKNKVGKGLKAIAHVLLRANATARGVEWTRRTLRPAVPQALGTAKPGSAD